MTIMSIFANPMFILISAVIAFIGQMFFEVIYISNSVQILENTKMEPKMVRNLNILESHQRCGITSGGRDECWWGCLREDPQIDLDTGQYFTKII